MNTTTTKATDPLTTKTWNPCVVPATTHGNSDAAPIRTDRLTEPLRWTNPRRIFVNSLSDLFHESIPDEFIDRVFAVMALAPRHTFQILTKRPERMREFFRYDQAVRRRILGVAWEMLGRPTLREYFHGNIVDRPFPLSNVWLGVTCENQHFADERIPLLLQTAAAVRFVSYEPALGLVDFENVMEQLRPALPVDQKLRINSLYCCVPRHLNWVICGGESGPKARPMDLAWARSARDQCRDAGVPFFMKQICNAKGRHIPIEQWPEDLRVREYPANGVS